MNKLKEMKITNPSLFEILFMGLPLFFVTTGISFLLLFFTTVNYIFILVVYSIILFGWLARFFVRLTFMKEHRQNPEFEKHFILETDQTDEVYQKNKHVQRYATITAILNSLCILPFLSINPYPKDWLIDTFLSYIVFILVFNIILFGSRMVWKAIRKQFLYKNHTSDEWRKWQNENKQND